MSDRQLSYNLPFSSARPMFRIGRNILRGTARVVELYGDPQLQIKLMHSNDCQALAADWRQIGQDISDAFTIYESQAPPQSTPAVKTTR